jgi:hypothetical protein
MPDPLHSHTPTAGFDYSLDALTIADLTDSLLAKYSGGFITSADDYADVVPQVIDINHGSFTSTVQASFFPLVVVRTEPA